MDRKRTNKKRSPSPKKAQGSLEYIIMVAGVLIVVIAFLALYLHSASNTKIGNAESLVAAGSSGSSELTLVFSEPLPTNANDITINLAGSGGSVTESNVPYATPTYANNYPEYAFSLPTGVSTITYDNVTSVSYVLNGQTIDVPSASGNPVPVQPITSNVVNP